MAKVSQKNEYQNVAVIYARYSSHNQRDVSIDQQIKDCRKYAERLGIKVVDVYADRALTGTNDKRPDFQRMIRDAETGAFSYVIVYTLDRFARDRYDSAVYKRQLRNVGVKVLSAMENISDDPTGILMESMLEGLAEYYSKELSRKITRGMRDNAEKGLANGSMPYGFKRGEDGRYQIEPEQAEIVREIFERFDAGESFVSIQTDLNNRGLKTKKGASWNRSSFNSMMSNIRYTGVYSYDGVCVPGAIPRIIEQDLFDRVQERLHTKKTPRGNPQKRRRENSVYLLTGKIFCGHCKSPMVGISGKSNGKVPYYYYVCQKHRQEKSCKKKAVRRDWIERKIALELRETVLSDDVINWLANLTIDYFNREKETDDLAGIREQLADTQKKIENIMAAIEQGIITNSTKQRLAELEDLETKLTAKIALSEKDKGEDITKDQIIAWLLTFRDGDVDDKSFQELLFDTFLVAVYLYDDHFRIVFNYSGDKSDKEITFDPGDIEDIAEDAMEVRTSDELLHHKQGHPSGVVLFVVI